MLLFAFIAEVVVIQLSTQMSSEVWAAIRSDNNVLAVSCKDSWETETSSIHLERHPHLRFKLQTETEMRPALRTIDTDPARLQWTSKCLRIY